MIKNLIFDLGGVVIDIYRDSAVESFRRLGLADADRQLDAYTQNGIFLELESGRMSEAEFVDELGKMCGRQLSEDEVENAWLGFFRNECADPRRLEFISSLRDRYRVYLLSNTNPFVMRWAGSSRFSPLGEPLHAYMDKVYLSYEIGEVKPGREIFEHVLADSGVIPSETLFIDDGPANVETGISMGLHTLCPSSAREWMDRLAAMA